MITKDQKTAVISANAVHEGDTGSPEVQIAILTERIRLPSSPSASASSPSTSSSIRRTTTAVSACTRWSVSAAACSTT